ncbi:hypothetical protein ZEAMMB73_Zm00001d006910 [Zea mays]|uniref:DUF4057 domain-containing protein n=2 Tax=Zea mays TaxID=4577 RepID=A0A1D6F205_MAIZE|nr:hypothetical protein ZEAMMB73_Zm00001d006910 [Zea mays]
MERPAPVRKSHTSTADLLIWPEGAPQESPAGATPPSNRRPHQVSAFLSLPHWAPQVHWLICGRTSPCLNLSVLCSVQPSEALRKVVFGGQVTEEEAESLNKRKPCSAPKWKEMTGSGIFAAGGEAEEDESANASATPIRTAPKNYQAISTISHISFSEEESISPKKPTSIAEVAKQRELSGTLLSEDDSKMKKQISDLKSKELSGHDIFAPPEDPRPRNSENGSTSQTPGKNAHVLTSELTSP